MVTCTWWFQLKLVISFEREGTTIFYNLNLNFVQAALGDTVDIPTVHGDVELVIPEGTQTGKRFRLRGKGAPSLRGVPLVTIRYCQCCYPNRFE